MAAKLVSIALLAFVVAQGHAIFSQETLEGEEVHFISHPLYSRVISIPKWWFDRLLSCDIRYPTGITYQAFPNSNLPDFDELIYSTGVEPFNGCSLAFSHSDRIQGFSGTYELQSLVQHVDQTMTLTRKEFHVSITVSEVEMPHKAEVNIVEN